MNLANSVIFIYLAFVASSALEIYFFMMQRSAIEIGRSAGFNDKDSRRMLPYWYLLVWPAKIVKWWAAISIAIEQHWASAIALLGAALLFQVLIPIPHGQYFSIFNSKLAKEIGEAVQVGNAVESRIYAQLYAALNEALNGQ